MTSFAEISGPAGRTGHRGALLGLRQLRHPVQGLRQPRARRAPSRRRSPTRPPCTGSPGSRRPWRCTSPGTWSTTTTALARVRRGPRRRPRHRQLQHLPGRRLQARAASPTPTRRSAARPIDHNLECLEVMDRTGSRDLKIWLADGTNYPGQGDMRARQDWLAESLATIYASCPTTSGWCWSTSSSSRRSTTPTSRTGARRTSTWPRWATKAIVCLDTGHHAPGTNIEFIVDAAAAAGEARLVRLQQPVLRRRRPDRRGGRPLPALPDHGRGGPGRRLRPWTATSR